MKRISKLLLALVPALLALTLSAPASAEVPKPNIIEAKPGTKCVQDPAVMRREHPDLLKHHRDEMLRDGIRTKTYSLEECINCHVSTTNTAEHAVDGGEKGGQFCMNCHAYAGVKIDCFECHSTKPEKSAQFHPIVTPGMKALKDVHQPDTGALLNDVAGANGSNKTGASQ